MQFFYSHIYSISFLVISLVLYFIFRPKPMTEFEKAIKYYRNPISGYCFLQNLPPKLNRVMIERNLFGQLFVVLDARKCFVVNFRTQKTSKKFDSVEEITEQEILDIF